MLKSGSLSMFHSISRWVFCIFFGNCATFCGLIYELYQKQKSIATDVNSLCLVPASSDISVSENLLVPHSTSRTDNELVVLQWMGIDSNFHCNGSCRLFIILGYIAYLPWPSTTMNKRSPLLRSILKHLCILVQNLDLA